MREITTRTEHILFDDTGIVMCKAFKDSDHTLGDAKENIHAVKILAEGKRVPVFVDITLVRGANREARAYLASDEAATVQSACALLINSPISRLVGNFFLGLNKTKFPTQLFTEERKALEWLKTYV